MDKENIEKILENIGAEKIPAEIHKIARETSNNFSSSLQQTKQPKQHILLEQIMRSRITKLAAAAVICIMCMTSLFFWKSTGSGIALADVLTRIEQVSAYMYKMNCTEKIQHTARKWTSTVLVSKNNEIKMNQTSVDLNSGESRNDEIYLLPRENTVLLVFHKEKNILRIKHDVAQEDYFFKGKYNDPRAVIKEILNCSHISLGQSVIDGSTVEGFQSTDPTYKGGFYGRSDFIVGGIKGGGFEKVDVKLWVDVETFLPIRFEEDLVTKGGVHTHEVIYDFRWNVVVNDDDFKPNITEDYTSPMGNFNIPASSEENVIKGLRLFADYTGSYPVFLDNAEPLKNKVEQYYLETSSVSFEKLSEEEKTQRNNERFIITTPVAFYYDLVTENKNPAYYGKTVIPKDADKILLRWKLSDSEYRVIYGDLHAETVTPEKLAELEKALP